MPAVQKPHCSAWFFAERGLQNAQAIRRRRQRFDGTDVAALDLNRQRQAGAGQHAIDNNSARATHAMLAADMGAGGTDLLAQEIRQQHARLGLPLGGLSVQRKLHIVTRPKPSMWSLKHLVDQLAPDHPHQIAAIPRAGMHVIAGIEIVGEFVQRIVNGAALDILPVAHLRRIGDAADRELHTVRRPDRGAGDDGRNRHDAARPRGMSSVPLQAETSPLAQATMAKSP